jgi:hypothetical protein
MSQIIVPQQPQDPVAALVGTQIDALLAELYRKRAELTEQRTGVDRRGPTGDAQIDRLNVELGAQISDGLATINQLIDEIETFALDMTRGLPVA